MLALIRTAAWIVVLGLIVVSVVPAPLRPGTGVSHSFEHFCAFLLAGAIWYLAYPDRLTLWLGSAVAYAAGIELIQTAAPGRHARLSDFAFDALGACLGLLISFVVARRYKAYKGEVSGPRGPVSVRSASDRDEARRNATSP